MGIIAAYCIAFVLFLAGYIYYKVTVALDVVHYSNFLLCNCIIYSSINAISYIYIKLEITLDELNNVIGNQQLNNICL